MSTVYKVVSSYNATISDVGFPVAWTMVTFAVLIVLVLGQFVFPWKSAKSFMNKSSRYTELSKDVTWILLFTSLSMISFYTIGWAGYINGILGNYAPGNAVAGKFPIVTPQDTFNLVCSSIILFQLFILFVYRLSLYMAINKNSAPTSLSENYILGQDTNLIFDYPSKKAGFIFLRYFCGALVFYSFMLFVTIYPYSVNGYLLTIPMFGASATMNFISGVLLIAVVVWRHIRAWWHQEKENADVIVGKLLSNTECVTHSYTGGANNFGLAGHIPTFYVPWMWIPSFGFFWYTTIFMITCSTVKTNTIVVCTWFLAAMLSILAQSRCTFWAFFYTAVFTLFTWEYILQYAAPPTPQMLTLEPAVNGSSVYTVDINYLTTKANCSSSALSPVASWIQFTSFFGFSLGVATLLTSVMLSSTEDMESTTGDLQPQPKDKLEAQ